MKVEQIEQDGEPRRRFFLLMEVTFRDRAREQPPGVDYYDDSELPDIVADWVRAALDDRDDSPRVRLMALPDVLDVDIQSVARGDYPHHEEERF